MYVYKLSIFEQITNLYRCCVSSWPDEHFLSNLAILVGVLILYGDEIIPDQKELLCAALYFVEVGHHIPYSLLSGAYLARWVIKINPAVRSQSNPQQRPILPLRNPRSLHNDMERQTPSAWIRRDASAGLKPAMRSGREEVTSPIWPPEWSSPLAGSVCVCGSARG